jgi:hypothetical protein
VLRKGAARELSSDGKIGGGTEHSYYEVCTASALFNLVAALIRTTQASAFVPAYPALR